MRHTLQLAWRNLGRNRRRTVITGVALAIGMSLCVATYGLMDGMNADILRALTRLDLGHIQLAQEDYPRRAALELTLPDAAALQQRAAQTSGVQAVTPRVYGFGLASHQAKSLGVQLVGVDPERELRVTELDKERIDGSYLDPRPTPWPEPRRLTAEEKAQDEAITARVADAVLQEIEQLAAGSEEVDQPPAQPAPAALGDRAADWTRRLADQLSPPPQRPPRVYVGATLAKILKVGVGGRIYLLSQTVDGMSAETSFEVGGIFRTGTALYDRNRVYLNLADLQRFLRLDGRIHELVLRAHSAEAAPAVAERLAAAIEHDAVLVRSWDEIRPDIKNMLQLNSVSTGLMVGIIFIVAALGVVNTMLMAVFERTRELGMLKAIGLSAWRIMGLIIAETLLLVLGASVVGLAVGLAMDLYLMVYGLDLSSFSEGISFGGMGIQPVIHAVITVQGLLVPVVVLSAISFLAACYPAARAARLRPAQGMREV